MEHYPNRNKYLYVIVFLLCFGAFTLMLQQNFVKANHLYITDDKYTNISDFLDTKTNNIIISNIGEAQEKYLYTFDTDSDYSFQKYLSDQNPLKNKKYEPSDLELIGGENIIVRASRPYLRQAAATALQELGDAIYNDRGEKLYVLSAYRSYKDQTSLIEAGCTSTRCAKIGSSEHQLGLAVDIHLFTEKGYKQFTTGALQWMDDNAYKYGFISTYRKGPKIDGKMVEIWHRRYVGVPFATKLYESNMSFAQRVKNEKKF